VGRFGHSLSGISKAFLTLALLGLAGALLLSFSASAADAPKKLATAQPGDCAACHGGDKVLPDKHMDTKAMKFGDCMPCHGKDEVSLKSKMPTSHAHTLAGISCQACHGKKTPIGSMDYKGCLPCHSTETLAKPPAKDHFLPNPHNSHYGTDVDCSLCHHQHKKSEYMCTQCHDFKNVTPSPMNPLKFKSKADGGKAPEAKPTPEAGKAAPQ